MNLIKSGLKKVLNFSSLFENNLKYCTSLTCGSKSFSNFSILSFNSFQKNIFSVSSPSISAFLTQTRSYKVKTRLRKRCRHCYFVWRNGRLYVECPEHPRHKQHHKTSMLKGYESISNGYDPKSIMNNI